MIPTVSIVIPVKNEAEFLPHSISALLKAITYYGDPAEIIIVDNGSTDSTVEIASSFGCIVLENNDGNISRLRNIGAHAALGKYLGFIDADCVVAEFWLTICVESLRSGTVGIVGTRAIPDLGNATWVENGWFRLISGVERPDYPFWIGTSNMLMLRSVFLDVGGFDENLVTAEDVNLCRKVLRNSSIKLEKRIDTIHLRESKTIYQLIRREFWRGKYSVREALAAGSLITDWKQNIFYLLNFISLVGIVYELMAFNLIAFVLVVSNMFFPIILIVNKRAKIRSFVQFAHVYAVGYL
ncbi:MAG: glycosyltransferase, partial [Legionellales bacterium]